MVFEMTRPTGLQTAGRVFLKFGIWNLEFGGWNLEFEIWNRIWNLKFEI
jgi:hypothetical protein